jgi:hypothetical protein
MANSLVTPTWVTNETALRFMNSVKGIANFNRTYDDQYRVNGAKVGNTVQARIPTPMVVRRGQAWSPQNLLDRTKPLTLSYQSGVDFEWSSAQATTEIDRVRERYVNPAADALASDADAQGMADVYPYIWNTVGTPGTTPTTRLTYLQAVQKIRDGSGPDEGLKAVLDGYAAINISDANAALFNPSAAISESNRRGLLGKNMLGIEEWYQDQMVPKHTTGTFTASTPIVNSAGQTGSSITSTGWANGATTLKRGDRIKFSGVYGVNPLSKTSTGVLQDFVLTADLADSGGAITLLISPSIITSGALQTVTNAPANNATVTVWSANPAGGTLATTVSPQSLIFHRDFAAFVMADLVDPIGGAKATFVRSRDFGISIRFVQQYLIGTDQNGSRLDMLFGAAPLQERLAVRVVG